VVAHLTDHIYGRLAPLYDLIYGAALQPGRRRAIARLAPRAGESILEVGVGTGYGLADYPEPCRVTAIDISASMLGHARARLERHGFRHVGLARMDACHLGFQDAQFDAVYAPYIINVVRDPVGAGREMVRVCRPGGRLVLLNHFERLNGSGNVVNRIAGMLAKKVSNVNWDLDFTDFVARVGMEPVSIESVNVPRVSSVVLCRRL
jgi:phosphatidylethanolamine/phosphatidyl-N-methylethanolamine N-methyltransferase